MYAPIASTSGKGNKQVIKVDKFGRPLETKAKSNELKRYYRMEEPAAVVEDEENDVEDDESDDEIDELEATPASTFIDRARGAGGEESSEEEADDSDSGSEGSVTLAPATLRRRRTSPSRSPSIDLSESGYPLASGSELDQDDSEDDGPTVDPTKRIAVVNMDWDHIRASDLFRVLASSLSATALPAPAAPKISKNINKKFDADGEEVGPYKPPSRLNLAQGRLLSVKIYPSKFGTERMEREAREGPPAAVFSGRGGARASDEEEEDDTTTMKRKSKKSRKQREESEDEEVTEKDIIREQVENGDGEEYDGEALRQYQLERLRCVTRSLLVVFNFAHDVLRATDTTMLSLLSILFQPHLTYMVKLMVPNSSGLRTCLIYSKSILLFVSLFLLMFTFHRFVPVETSFEEDPIHDEATESTIAAAGPDYQGVEFVTDVRPRFFLPLSFCHSSPLIISSSTGLASFESQAHMGR